MKKIISLIAAVAMMSTMFVATASAAISKATIKTTAVALTNEEYHEYMGIDIPDGYEGYKISASVSGLGDLEATKSGKNWNGRRMSNFTYYLDFSDGVDKDNTYTVKTAFSDDTSILTEGFENNKFGIVFAPNAANAYPRTATKISDTIENAYVIVATVKPGTTVSVEAMGQVMTYTSGKGADAEVFNASTDNREYSPKTLTLGGTTTKDPSYSITKEYKDAANKGYVWDVTISDFNTTKNSAMANFKVSDDEKASAEITGLDGIESDGSCNFAVILNTEKTLAATDGFTITFPAK